METYESGESSGARPPAGGRPDFLSVRDVSLTFGGVKALDGMSLSVARGQICGLIGPNGAGKTTLFNCVSRVYTPQAGRIELEGADLLGVRSHGVAARGVARTFQNLGLFPSMTFLENVVVGGYAPGGAGFLRAVPRIGMARREREERIRAYELLERLNLGHLAFEKAADQPFGTLKRLELARALAGRPRLLLLDEPAGGLTNSEVDELAAVIRRIRDDFELTVLLVEHHMGMVMALSDSVVAMSAGRKLAEGTADEVRAHPEVIAAYLGGAA